MKTKIVVCMVLIVCAISTTRAQFFGGIVFDPKNYSNSILRYFQLQQQTRQLLTSYRQMIRQYQHVVKMAQTIKNMERYRVIPTPWATSNGPDTYGNTSGWSRAINTGTGVVEGYRQAIEELREYGTALGDVPQEQVQSLKARYATVELTDAANLHGIELLGKLRQNAQVSERTLRMLEDDSLSSNDDLNTQIAVLNKINAANMIAVSAAQDTNQLLVSVLEQQITESKRRRDREAASINDHIAFYQKAMQVGSEGIAGTTDVIKHFRLRY